MTIKSNRFGQKNEQLAIGELDRPVTGAGIRSSVVHVVTAGQIEHRAGFDMEVVEYVECE